jgi:hypothetical protein
VAALLSKRSQPRCHRPGASPRSACLSSTPPAAIARGGSFAPTRSTRTPPVAAYDVHRLELPASWGSVRTPHISEPDVNRRSDPRLPGTFRSHGSAWERAASRTPPRRGARSAAPEMPSVAGFPPAGGPPSPPQAVPSLWRNSTDAFSILKPPESLTKLREARELGRARVRPTSRAGHTVAATAAPQATSTFG